MKKIARLIVITLMLVSMVACTTHIHKVGKGAQGNDVTKTRQWYVLWGLVPLNEVDTQEMAKGAENYEIKTETCFVDGIINAFVGAVTVSTRSVEFKK
jgi:hypothetical protein